MKTADSLERERYHVWLEKFKSCLFPGALVYDIGKSRKYDYAETFQGFVYETIDKNATIKPDHVLSLESINSILSLKQGDGLLFNGVVEQCENPFTLLEVLYELLAPGGVMLVGTVLTGFPVYDNDRFRFTEMGIKNVLRQYQLLGYEVVYRPGVKDPTYIYLIVRKGENV